MTTIEYLKKRIANDFEIPIDSVDPSSVAKLLCGENDYLADDPFSECFLQNVIYNSDMSKSAIIYLQLLKHQGGNKRKYFGDHEEANLFIESNFPNSVEQVYLFKGETVAKGYLENRLAYKAYYYDEEAEIIIYSKERLNKK